MEDDNPGLGLVFVGVFGAFLLSGLALVTMGVILHRRGAGPWTWLAIATGVAILAIPLAATTYPALLS